MIPYKTEYIKDVVKISSVFDDEIRLRAIGKDTEYVITPGLMWSKLVHLNNCNGKQAAGTFHSWKALRASMVHLHPKIDWVLISGEEREGFFRRYEFV